MAANRVMKSICSWLERKLFLRVNAAKTKAVRPARSKYLEFTFLKKGSEWKVRPANEKKKKLKKKLSEYLKIGKSAAGPAAVTIKRINEIVRGWINYFRIGMMKMYMEELGGMAKTQSPSNHHETVEETKSHLSKSKLSELETEYSRKPNRE